MGQNTKKKKIFDLVGPSEKSILTARVANHRAGFGSSCPLTGLSSSFNFTCHRPQGVSQTENSLDTTQNTLKGVVPSTCNACRNIFPPFTPFAVHLRKIYIHVRQQLKLYGKYTFISTAMNFINANELSITLFAFVLIFNSINR